MAIYLSHPMHINRHKHGRSHGSRRVQNLPGRNSVRTRQDSNIPAEAANILGYWRCFVHRCGSMESRGSGRAYTHPPLAGTAATVVLKSWFFSPPT
eukprot:gene9134-biopygen9233